MENVSFGIQLEMDLEPNESIYAHNKFFKYHRDHPEVYETFKRLALKSIYMGHKHFSARGLFQVMRWQMAGAIKEDGFKYNNNHTPYYVRLFEKEFPKHEGFFEKRKVKKDLNQLN